MQNRKNFFSILKSPEQSWHFDWDFKISFMEKIIWKVKIGVLSFLILIE